MSTPKKVGGTKHRASPPLQKVRGKCPPVHPQIYAHANYDNNKIQLSLANNHVGLKNQLA